GGMVLLPKLLRSDQLRKLTYTADAIGASAAQAIGLVTDLAEDPEAAALSLAEKIAGKSPSAMRAAKRLIAVAESGAAQGDILLEESREQAALIGKPHQMEVIAANMQKRAPRFD
ncbi:MAG: enoyl-CoA hydratase, partial [Thalassovita sp.]|nr:enoyl-CoA hydratase [Thalassovita sp.]